MMLDQRVDAKDIRTTMQINLSCAVDCNCKLTFQIKDVFFCVRLDEIWNIGFKSLVHFE